MADDEVARALLEGLTRPRPRHELIAGAGAGFEALVRCQFLIDQMECSGLLTSTLALDGRAMATLVYRSPPSHRAGAPRPAGARPRLSRLASIHPEGDALVLSAAAGPALVRLADPEALHFIAALGGAASGPPPWPEEAVAAMLDLLERAQALEGPESGPQAMWSRRDLALHWHSRGGDCTAPYGPQFPFQGRFPPPPAVKPATGERIALARPDPEAVARRDPSFGAVLEGRRSRRLHGSTPIALGQLAEFLYRTARVSGSRDPAEMELTSRPYPSGGACYELELYLLPSGVPDLPGRLYRYDPLGHALLPLRQCPEEAARRLTAGTAAALHIARPPQLLFVIAARFARVQWKYSEMAYALTLKHVGVLTQTMYLVAEAMGLAGCAVGGGTGGGFAAATGLDPLEEDAVGEFILGTRAED